MWKTLSTPYKLKEHSKKCLIYLKNTTNVNNNTMGNNNNVGNITNNITNNVNIYIKNEILIFPYLFSYGINRLSSSEQNELLNINNNPHLTLFRLIHCNPSRDTCHNIYYEQKHHPNVWVYNGEA